MARGSARAGHTPKAEGTTSGANPRQRRRHQATIKPDPSGRYRHTFRLEHSAEEKLRLLSDLLGIDMNAAVAVAISAHYQQLKGGERGG
jgi:hypothetical protein